MASTKITVVRDKTATEQVIDETTTGLDQFGDDRGIVAVRVDGELRDLDRPLPDGATVEPVTIDSPDGLNILRHSAAHVTAQAVQSQYAGQARHRPADHRRLLLRLRGPRALHA